MDARTDKRKSAKAQTSADVLRERRIARLVRKLAKVSADARRDVWEQMRGEIAARSPAQVAKMEAERGLA